MVRRPAWRAGAYVLGDAKPGKPEVILIGTGSELSLCVEAYEALARDGVAARVVSMPSWELFEEQDAAYRDSVLPADVTARVSVEAASPVGWDRYVGRDGAKVAMNGFRRLRAGQGSVQEIRLHPGQGGRRRQGTAGKVEETPMNPSGPADAARQ